MRCKTKERKRRNGEQGQRAIKGDKETEIERKDKEAERERERRRYCRY